MLEFVFDRCTLQGYVKNKKNAVSFHTFSKCCASIVGGVGVWLLIFVSLSEAFGSLTSIPSFFWPGFLSKGLMSNLGGVFIFKPRLNRVCCCPEAV